jgi:hypothetical protein
MAATRARVALRLVVSSTRRASRSPRRRGLTKRFWPSASWAARTASSASLLAPLRLAGRMGRPTSTACSPCCCKNAARPAPKLPVPSTASSDGQAGARGRSPAAAARLPRTDNRWDPASTSTLHARRPTQSGQLPARGPLGPVRLRLEFIWPRSGQAAPRSAQPRSPSRSAPPGQLQTLPPKQHHQSATAERSCWARSDQPEAPR